MSMIIQCPSCSTRFSIDHSLLVNLEQPRFHCSRCGHYFDHSKNNNQLETKEETSLAPSLNTEQEETETTSEITETKENDSPFEPFERKSETPKAEQLQLIPEEQSSPFFDNPQLEEDEIDESIKADWPGSDSEVTVEADLTEFASRNVIKESIEQTESQSPEIDFQSYTETEINEDLKQSLEHEIKVIEEETFDSSETVSAVIGEEIPRTEQDDEVPVAQKEQQLEGGLETEVLPFPSQAADKNKKRTKKKRKKTPRAPVISAISRENYRAFVFVLLGPLLITGILGFAAIYLEGSPASLRQALLLEPKSIPLVPPDSLKLTPLQAKQVTLSDGKRALEITGDIHNETTVHLSQVQLEVEVYDRDNHVMARTRAFAENGLGGTVGLSSLKQEIVGKLQEQLSLGAKPLQPDERRPFRVVLSSIPEKARWYSVRVFSAVHEAS